ncbi:MAG TPA: ribonuclease III [Ktedonobacterales bacterium]|nr:ribonuclease III [Ktedonobacterales bacterium]
MNQQTQSEQAPLDTLEERIGASFSDRALLVRALTHHSICPQTAQRDAYDTLEFLGDALISAYVVEHLFHAYPDATEGELTALKSEVVSRRVFAQIGLGLGLMEFIRADPASLRTFNDRSRESLCADVLEALVGAIHLDAGRAAGEAFVSRFILPVIPEVRATLGERNPKGALQQHVLRQTGQLPHYEVLEERGESNDRSYLVGVYAGDRLLGRGEGSSIKAAGREAARAALAGEFPDGAGLVIE